MQKAVSFDSLPDLDQFEKELECFSFPASIEAIQTGRYELLDSETVEDLYDFLFDISNGIDPKQPFLLDISDCNEVYDDESWADHPSLTIAERN